jgi:wyosine [tRNA(Phe)-imidazoG37] synthetase (radical SAM superfamily)
MVDWDPKVLTALIAALASLAIAVYQSIARRREVLAIEELKSSLEQERELQGEYLARYLEYVMEGKEHELTAFREMLQHVQALREKIRTVTHPSYSHDAGELAKELRQLAEAIATCFASNQTYFSEANWKQAHTLKNKSSALAGEFSDYLATVPRGEALTVPSHVTDREKELAALQHEFRDSAFSAARAFSDSLRAEVQAGERNA